MYIKQTRIDTLAWST